MQQPEFRVSADASAIARAMEQLDVGDKLTYAEIEEIVGRDAKSVRRAIATAARIMLREKRMVFGVIRNIGFVRLNDAEIVGTFDQARHRVRRASERALMRLVCVEYTSLPKDLQVRHNAALSVLGAIAEMSSAGSVRKVERSISECGTSIPSAKTAIAAFSIGS